MTDDWWESSGRLLAPQARAEREIQLRREVERVEFLEWEADLREKLVAALQAAAEGQPAQWDVWPRPQQQGAPTAGEAPEIHLDAEPRSYTRSVPYRPPDIAALFDALKPRRRVLACAPDVYGRVKAAVEASAVAELFEVVENPWLNDGQVLSIDPAAFELPPFELPADWLAPKYRCLNCCDPIHDPGHCLRCEPFAKALARDRTLSALITGLGGLGF